MLRTRMVIHHCTLPAIRISLRLLNSSFRGNVASTFQTKKVRLLRISLSIRMETVYFTLPASGVMWVSLGTSSLIRDATSTLDIPV